MEIKAVDGRLTLASLFAPVAVGYGIGAGVLFLPVFLMMAPIFLLSPEIVDQNGQTISSGAMFLPMIIMLPFMLVFQGLMFGGLVLLGLAIYRKWRPVRVAMVREIPDADSGATP